MTIDTATDRLPTVVTTYLTTPKADLGALVSHLFTGDAVVHDEGRTHIGLDAIRAWTDGIASAFTFTRTVTGTIVTDNAAIVSARLEGDFPGSPVDLHHHFSLAGNTISALTICP